MARSRERLEISAHAREMPRIPIRMRQRPAIEEPSLPVSQKGLVVPVYIDQTTGELRTTLRISPHHPLYAGAPKRDHERHSVVEGFGVTNAAHRSDASGLRIAHRSQRHSKQDLQRSLHIARCQASPWPVPVGVIVVQQPRENFLRFAETPDYEVCQTRCPKRNDPGLDPDCFS